MNVIDEAKSWIGTPYHLNARIKGVGVDCGQFIIACFVGAGKIKDITLPHLKPDFNMHRGEDIYINRLKESFREVETPQPEDIAVFQIGRIVCHGGIVVEWPEIIHVPYGGIVMYDDAGLDPLASRLRGFWRLNVLDTAR